MRDPFISRQHLRTAKKEENRVGYTKKWVLNTVEKLSTSEIEELKRYFGISRLEIRDPNRKFRKPQDSSKLKRKGQPKRILASINKSHDVTPEDAEALLNAIKDGKILMRFDSVFDELESK